MKKLICLAIAIGLSVWAVIAFASYGTANYSEVGGANWVIGGGGLTGEFLVDVDGTLHFEGATADDFETAIAVTDPTADRTITFPDSDQTVGTATSIQDDLIVKADFADEDWGDITISSNVATIDAGVVTEAKLTVISADGLHAYRVARATYDRAVDGGAQGAIPLGVTLPDNAVITRAYFDIITGMTSSGGTGTIAITTEGSGDVLAAVDADTLSTGLTEGIQTGTVGNMIKMTAAREITATIAAEDLTAGKFVVFIEYVVSD